MALALLAAAKNGDAKIVRCFLEKDDSLVGTILPSGKKVIDLAVQKGLVTLFQVKDISSIVQA